MSADSVGRAARGLVLGLLWIVIAHLAWPPVYAFPELAPFRGDAWHNPYAGTDGAGVWMRANFHAHSRMWGPLPPNTAPLERVRQAYRDLDYDVAAISNYMSITPPAEGEALYVSAYEHGYGWGKWHQTVVGASRVDWLDFPLWQTLSAKQYLLERLGRDAELIVINHPGLVGAYSRHDFRHMTGYHAVELRSRFAEADKYWDAALSSGRLVWGFSSDDTRKYKAPRHSGIGYVLVHARERTTDALLDALRRGRFVAVFAPQRREPNGFVSQTVDGERLRVRLREPADRIRVIGDDGAVRAVHKATDAIEHTLLPSDSYLRVHATTRDTEIFLQPVVRSDAGRDPADAPTARARPLATALRRATGGALAVAATWAFWFRRRGPPATGAA